MGGSLKTEAVVLRSMRYGEADRILHLYTPTRGRISAIAKGVRKTRSRFGGRLEPFFRLRLVLHEGRSDLLTVTSAETVEGYARLRDGGPTLDAAARACDAVNRLFGEAEPSEPVFHLLCNELSLLEGDAAHAGHANQLAFRLKLLVAAGFAPAAGGVRRVRGARPPRRLLGRRGRRRLRGLRGRRLPAGGRGAHASSPTRSRARWPTRRRARRGRCARPSARSPRRSSITPTSVCARRRTDRVARHGRRQVGV